MFISVSNRVSELNSVCEAAQVDPSAIRDLVDQIQKDKEGKLTFSSQTADTKSDVTFYASGKVKKFDIASVEERSLEDRKNVAMGVGAITAIAGATITLGAAVGASTVGYILFGRCYPSSVGKFLLKGFALSGIASAAMAGLTYAVSICKSSMSYTSDENNSMKIEARFQLS